MFTFKLNKKEAMFVPLVQKLRFLGKTGRGRKKSTITLEAKFLQGMNNKHAKAGHGEEERMENG